MKRNPVWQGMVSGFLELLMLIWLLPGMTIAQHQHTTQHVHTASPELPPRAFTQDSLYQLESIWTTASGQQIHLGDLRGKARVIVMNYTSCEYACPMLISQVKTIANTLSPEVRDQVGFVAVTFDPERDTPDVLEAYRAKMHLDPEHWTLLHGAPEDVLELAMLLGVKYKKDNQGGFAHSNLMTVLNKAGEIVGYDHVVGHFGDFGGGSDCSNALWLGLLDWLACKSRA